ncbi:MAG: hypothetical protein WBM29_03755 [Candidatus Deferrimicrobium sp.]
MNARMPISGYFLIALFSGVFLIGTYPAEAIIGKGGTIEGFGPLAWGISVEQAEKACPDLHFSAYEIENRKEEPVKIYLRNADPKKIGGVVFDSVEYGFKGDRFYKVRASLQSRFGPRTLITQAEASWNQMAEYLRRKYGAPKGNSTHYVTEYLVVVKDMRWETGGVFIHLNYKGLEGENEDQLIFEIGK